MAYRWRTQQLGWAVAVLVAGIVGGLAPAVHATPLPTDPTAPPAQPFVVSRVVDGDTVAGTWADGRTDRIRFLNVDTPEMGTCLAEKAKRFTRRRLPAGSTPGLTFDADLFDPYGRVLAVVTPERSGSLSVALAARGLGVPVRIRPNVAHYPAVVAATRRARRHERGLFSPRIGCSPARQFAEARRHVTQAKRQPVRTRREYDAALRHLVVARAAMKRVRPRFHGLQVPWFRTWVRAQRKPLRKRISKVRAAKRQAWESRPKPPKPKSKSKPKPTPTPSPDPGGYWPPGVPRDYTGPRCYAPGGLTWRPC